VFEKDKRIDLNKVFECKTLLEFDTHFVAKISGFESTEDYYHAANVDWKLKLIRTPTLFLNAADDMFSPESGLLSFP
jgi:predicted alpha/beta-fold hydrolase